MHHNPKIFIFSLLTVLFLNCQKKATVAKDPVAEIPEEWIQLFNGKDLDDWIVKINGHALHDNIHNTFSVEDGVLKVSYDGYEKFGESYGHIFFKKPFSNYRLKLQYRFVGEQVPDGQAWATKNSGVMIHSQSPESMLLDQGFPISLEVQLLGGVQEGVERPTANLCTPGTHVMMNDALITEHCINSSSETFYGEEWIDLEVLVLRDSLITHMINGKEVIRYARPTLGGDHTPDTEKWKSREGELLKEGYISLQSESHPVEFRKIKLLELQQ